MVHNNALGLTCTLEDMELLNFLSKKDLRTNEHEYNEELFKKLLHISHSLGSERRNYIIITVKNNLMNSDINLPEEVTYYTQKIINDKTQKEASVKDISSGIKFKIKKLKRLVNRLKKAPINTIDNILNSYVSHSALHGFGLFADKSMKANIKIGRIDGQLVDRKHIHRFRKSNKINGYNEWTAISEDKLLARPFRTKYGFINHSRLPNVVLDGLDIIVIREIKKDEEILIDYRKEFLGDNYINSKGTYL